MTIKDPNRFWEKPIAELNRAEWEALCDGCGKCCLHKVEDIDTGRIYPTNVACKLLDTHSGQCTDYKRRKFLVPDCIRLTKNNVDDFSWLPKTCAYKLRAEGKPLFDWHYLISGNHDTIAEAGISVRDRVISEDHAGALEQHIVKKPL